jgi:hypothetical protein
MYALVAGRFRTVEIPVLEEVVSRIKTENVSKKEVYKGNKKDMNGVIQELSFSS